MKKAPPGDRPGRATGLEDLYDRSPVYHRKGEKAMRCFVKIGLTTVGMALFLAGPEILARVLL